MSGILTGLLPNGGTHFAYGTLGGRTCEGVLMTDLSYNKKKFEGWLLTNWILEHGKGLSTLLRINAATKTVHRGLENNGWSSSKYLDCKLDNMWEMFLDMKMKTLVRVVDIFSVFSLGPPPSVTDELNAFDVFLFCWANPYLFSLTLLQVESGSSLGRPFPV